MGGDDSAGGKGLAHLLKNVFCAGGAAVITVSFIHPLDVVKTRLQVSGEKGRTGGKQYTGLVDVVKTTLSDEGANAFYKGIGAAYMREASYTSLRLGLYEPMKGLVGADKKDSSAASKFLAGALAGGIGSLAGNPFDVLKTRMMANQGANLGVGHFAKEVYKYQGVGGFYKGIEANIMRAMVLNATKMACYDICKQFCKNTLGIKEGMTMQFMSAFTAGFFMTCTVSPFDMIRTRLMNQPTDQKLYNGFVDCFFKILRNEGPLGFYKGFIPIWSRFAPTTCLQLMIFEQLRKVVGLGAM
jgi:hypothetical protein